MTATTPGGSFPVIGMATAWTPGTNGPVSADAVFAPITSEEDLAQFKGKLQGKVVLTQALRDVPALWTAAVVAVYRCAARRADARNRRDAAGALRRTRWSGPSGRTGRSRTRRPARSRSGWRSSSKRRAPSRRSRPVAVVTAARCSSRERRPRTGSRTPTPACPQSSSPSSTTAASSGRCRRTCRSRSTSTSGTRFTTGTPPRSTWSGRFPAPTRSDEVVMLGAHFDSWHGATGATDNASGSAVMMEAMRILKQSGLKLRRTVRIGLWGGEEQGLIGSREYVSAPLRQRGGHDPEAGPREVRRLLQRGQRHRRNPRRLPPGQRGGRRRSSAPG